jgi:hypothetical protein
MSRVRLAMLVLAVGGCGAVAGQPETRPVMQDNYPRAFFFRSSEGMAANPRVTYARWDAAFNRLMGIMGKTLEEEVLGRSIRNIDFFTRFKKAHPEQIVLLHYNGNARDPRDSGGKFFAGHWIYYSGATILADVPAEAGETDIRVSDARLFVTGMGRYRTSNEDIGLCEVDAKGRPDWHRSEQVQLISVDRAAGTIRVRRGCYGTKPRAFGKGATAAAHVTEGPWGDKNNIMWFYNYALTCPRDKAGRTCSDVLVDDLCELFLEGGRLAAYDGLEFDVLHHTVGGGGGRRGADVDADGKADRGVVGGRNVYGAGVVEFCRALRKRFGEDRLIMADGHSPRNQRVFGILNGLESEGWPSLDDPEIRDWSGGLNRHFYWDAHAREPKLNYINHKFNEAGDAPGKRVRPKVPFSTHRLVFAGGVFTNSAICYAFTPPPERGEGIGIWDELRMGTENKLGWLGRPRGPAVRVATESSSMLPPTIDKSLLARISGEDVKVSLDGGRLKIVGTDKDAHTMKFRLAGVPCDGADLFVSLVARGETEAGMPPEVPRRMYVGAGSGQVLSAVRTPRTGMCLRGQAEAAIDRETGASVAWSERIVVGGTGRMGHAVHPPFRNRKVGYAFWTVDRHVPPDGTLSFHLGMGEKSPERSDGVTFAVDVAELLGGKVGKFERVFEASQKAHEWTQHTVSLGKWAGKTVRLKFIADCGASNNATTDQGKWGDVRLLSGAPKELTPYRSFMTWVGTEDFASGFYYNHVASGAVDLEFSIEGTEPLWISRIGAFAAPDAMFREFANGVVLANPAPHPHTFDMARRFPGQTFRRLQGSSRQDTEANNGKRVGAKVTLGAKDALFLVREKAK